MKRYTTMLGCLITLSLNIVLAGVTNAAVTTLHFEDDFESSLSAWDTTWSITSQQAYSGTYSVRASAGPGADGALTLKDGIDTSGADEIRIHFFLRQNYTDKNSDIFLNLYAGGNRVRSIDLYNANQLEWREYSFVYRRSVEDNDLFVTDLTFELDAPNLVYNGWFYTYPERVYLDDLSISTVSGDISFVPSVHGFKFVNGFSGDFFPLNPVLQELWESSGYGDQLDYFGLCGGMVYGALDCYNLGLRIPDDTVAPNEGDLYNYIWYRQLDAWGNEDDLIADASEWLTYGSISNPLSPFGLSGQWMYDMTPSDMLAETQIVIPGLLQSLDNNDPVPLFLILQSYTEEDWANFPEDVTHNHVVLCTGYDDTAYDNVLVLSIYDPNFPLNDTMEIQIVYEPGSDSIQWIQHSVMPVFGFFVPGYDYKNDITRIPAEIE